MMKMWFNNTVAPFLFKDIRIIHAFIYKDI